MLVLLITLCCILVTIPLDSLTTDIKDEGEDDDEGTDCHTASPVTISTIAYKPPPNRR
jgi:hypothetical protein